MWISRLWIRSLARLQKAGVRESPSEHSLNYIVKVQVGTDSDSYSHGLDVTLRWLLWIFERKNLPVILPTVLASFKAGRRMSGNIIVHSSWDLLGVGWVVQDLVGFRAITGTITSKPISQLHMDRVIVIGLPNHFPKGWFTLYPWT